MRIAGTRDDSDGVDLKGHTLVVPGIGGLAHLGELCVDALVETFALERVAVVQSRNALPMATASAWEKKSSAAAASGFKLTTSAELYQNTAVHPNLSVLQLRSPAAEGRRRALAEEIITWARDAGVAELVVVASCSSHVKVDADLGANTELRYVRLTGGDVALVPPTGPEALELPLLPLGFGGYGEPPPLPGGFDEDDLAGETPPAPELPPPGGYPASFHLLHGAGVARPLVLLAGDEDSGKAFPNTLCLLGLTGDIVDWGLTERLSKVLCLCVASKVGAKQAPSFSSPPSWHFQAEAITQQLWG